ncbi:MAG: hypothetical protein ALECFALPRED_002390 [Alectoria fallacina]|uniref:Uncharacterized protein n=1 Tax=Alectoria fallacina TaxID=1903189 RepID=A0A8H3FCJ3_9LECA|nr:MAG: hypothetical protein ALECFALPRED_002390 [Alectoria fallacina]
MCFEDPCRHPDLEGSLRPFATPPERTAGFAPTELQLNRLNEKGYNNEPGRGSQYIDQVTALLSAEGLLPMALVRWENSTDQHGVVQSSPAGTDYNHFLRTVELIFVHREELRSIESSRETGIPEQAPRKGYGENIKRTDSLIFFLCDTNRAMKDLSQ